MSLTDELIKKGYLKIPEIINAFCDIKRADFLRFEDKEEAEVNTPISIGYGQTISQPLTVAFMLELLQPRAGDKILDVGCGSGWTSALLAYIVGAQGKVYGLEIVPELKSFAEDNINKYSFIKKCVVQIFCTDGNKGLPNFSPFDKIVVSAAAPVVPPELVKQLRIRGQMVIPIGRNFESQEIVAIEKTGNNKYREKRFSGFIFVPLIKSRNT